MYVKLINCFDVCHYLILLFTDDATPSYIFNLGPKRLTQEEFDLTDTKAYLIKKFMPDAKILIILRDPTIR